MLLVILGASLDELVHEVEGACFTSFQSVGGLGPGGKEDVPFVGWNVVVAAAVGESRPGVGWG